MDFDVVRKRSSLTYIHAYVLLYRQKYKNGSFYSFHMLSHFATMECGVVLCVFAVAIVDLVVVFNK